MKKVFILIVFVTANIFAQNEWTLQPWMQVIGKYSGQKLGSAVSYLGKKNDSTLISVTDGSNNIYIYQIKSPADTIPIYTFKGISCLKGDFNGDGIPDLVITGNPTKIYLGKAPGVYDTTTAFFVKYSEPNGYSFGIHAAVGKINGDKYDDLVITDPDYPDLKAVGKLYIFWGGTSMDTIPNYTIQGDTIRAGFGWNVTTGNLNNDGYDDIIIKGYKTKSGLNGTVGFAYIKIFLGGETIDTTAWKYIEGGDNSDYGLSSFDINGDGIEDLLWTNYSAKDSMQSIYIHYSQNGDINTVPSLVIPFDAWASNIANAGDMNGDGYNDILTSGNYSDNAGNSYIFVFSGGPKMDTKFDAAVGLGGVSDMGAWGSITGIGDINGDGLADILVGAPEYNWFKEKGYWGIYLGSKNIPTPVLKEPNDNIPKTFKLNQNYPNPFNPSTIISWQLTKPAKVSLIIYNTLGQKLQELVNEEQTSGEHQVTFNANRYSSGVYFYRLTVVDGRGEIETAVKSLVLIK
ncbi:MAG: FG-GAP-like repeat-containing protein [Ignavibacteriaceae bacterium]|nr:FG-GAP-like repeat-containing protein [Ignavibacteriaceae bacterium]